MQKENTWFQFIILFIVSISQQESMFVVLHSDINSLKPGLLHLTGKLYCKKSRSEKVKDGIINLILRIYLIDRYNNISDLATYFYKKTTCQFQINFITEDYLQMYKTLQLFKTHYSYLQTRYNYLQTHYNYL